MQIKLFWGKAAWKLNSKNSKKSSFCIRPDFYYRGICSIATYWLKS